MMNLTVVIELIVQARRLMESLSPEQKKMLQELLNKLKEVIENVGE